MGVAGSRKSAPATAAAPVAPFPTQNAPPAAQFGIAQPTPANPELTGMLDDFFSKQG